MTKNNFTDWEKNCAEETTIDNLPDSVTSNLGVSSLLVVCREIEGERKRKGKPGEEVEKQR